MDTRWKHPFTCIVSGPTMCGKTVFVKRFLNNLTRMCDVRFDRVLFYYAEWQEAYRREFRVDNGSRSIVEFKEGLPQTSDYSRDNDRKKLIVLDDLMRESSSSTVLDLFTKGCHHKNISVIFITQNIFHKGANQRDLSLNSNYIVLFKNPRDRAQIQYLARQVYPEDPRFLQEAYLDACRPAHGYLLLDLKQDTPDEFRFRTRIFPDDARQYAYVPKYRK